MPLVGGLIIGCAATFFLLFNGRIAGISNIIGGLWSPSAGDVSWRWFFLSGLWAGGLTLLFFKPDAFGQSDFSLVKLGAAGLLVGLGTRIGNGCTSGHGVCGLSRRSFRSLVATLVFMMTAMITVYLGKQ